jgi:very-short-patch-repair endonuclease
MRFDNGDVFDNIDGVLDEIFNTLEQLGLRDV